MSMTGQPSSSSSNKSKSMMMNVEPPTNWEEIKKVDANQCCLVSRRKSELGGGGLKSILNFFQSACDSSEFFEKCNQLGLKNGVFTANELLRCGHPCYDRFSKVFLDELKDDDVIGLVFHGTHEQNVDAIACNGLDPKKRSGQSFGPGEYFATNPQISISYCKGGAEMFVFLVVVPKRNGSSGSHIARHCPAKFVVVNNNNHQLPLGTILFETVDQNVMMVMMESKKLREKLQSLASAAETKQLEAEETKIKAEIMQNLMIQNLEQASVLYLENREILTELSKREIAWYVNPFIKTEARFATFFPDLPAPLQANELVKADITSVEMSVRMESRAKRDLERTHKLVAKKKELEAKRAEEDKKFPKMEFADSSYPGIFDSYSWTKSSSTKAAAEAKEAEVGAGATKKKAPRSVLASILHHMTNNRVDVASELYMEKGHLLDGFAKREIANCVRRNIEEPEMIPILFPDLPDVAGEEQQHPVPPAFKKHKEEDHHGATGHDDDDDLLLLC